VEEDPIDIHRTLREMVASKLQDLVLRMMAVQTATVMMGFMAMDHYKTGQTRTSTTMAFPVMRNHQELTFKPVQLTKSNAPYRTLRCLWTGHGLATRIRSARRKAQMKVKVNYSAVFTARSEVAEIYRKAKMACGPA